MVSVRTSRVMSTVCAAVVILASCGSAGGPGSAESLDTLAVPRSDVIVVSSDSPLATQLVDNGSTDRPAAPTLATGVEAAAKTASLLTTSGSADDDEVARPLAEALGLGSDLFLDEAGGWTTRGAAGGELAVGTSGSVGSWTFSTDASAPMPASSCTTQPVSSTGCGGPAVSGPTEELATAAASRILHALGVSDEEVGLEVVRDDDATRVVARLLVDGVRSDGWLWSFNVNEAGDVTHGFGPTRAPVVVRTVALIGGDEIVARVGRSLDWAMPPMTVGAPAPTTAASTTMASVPATIADAVVDEIVSIGLIHESLWDVTGRQWLVPAYRIGTRNGLTTTVYAIEDSLVEIVDLGLPPRTTPPPAGPAGPAVAAPAPQVIPAPPPSSTAAVPTPSPVLPSTTTTQPDGASPGGTRQPCPGVANPPPQNQSRPTLTIPVAPTDAVQVGHRDEWGDAMADAILSAVEGLPIAEAAAHVRAMCWTVTIGEVGTAPTTATPDMLWNRIVLWERDGVVVDATFD